MQSDSTLRLGEQQIGINPRSMGIKFMMVCGLAVSMAIPGLFVGRLVEDRSRRAAEVVGQISDYAGGEQTFLGPTLVIPYKILPQVSPDAPDRTVYMVFPAVASAVLRTVTEERNRSLFRVPVFRADVSLDATFDLSEVSSGAPQDAELDWGRAEVVVGVSNPRGALADATVTADGKTIALVPAESAPDICITGDQSNRLNLKLFGTRVGALVKLNAPFRVTSSLRFSGAHRVAVLAYGKTTRLIAHGDWPHPSFDGGFLPIHRTVTRNAFSAEWSVPFIARGVRAEGPASSLRGLEATALGISFIEMADPYQSVTRSQKYVLLFVSLIFLTYFVFEVTTGRHVHPAQYFLVGIAQIIFYLLLLSLAERIGFDWAFLVAGAATVGLLSVNAGWVFGSGVQAVRALVTFALLYVLIYLLLRLEDNALLVGAIASFLAITATMYITRRIDWYSALAERSGAEQS